MTKINYSTDNLGSEYLNKQWNVSSEAKVLCDANRQILVTNQAFRELFSFTSQECNKQDIDLLITPPAFLPESDSIIEMILSDIPVALEAIKKTKANKLISLFQIVFSAITEKNDRVICYIFKNLPSNSRRIEDPLKDENIFIDSFEKSCEPAIYSDTHGNIVRANPVFVEEFGWANKELDGQNISTLMVPPTIKPESEYINAMQKTGQVLRLHTLRKTKNNKTKKISLISLPAVSLIHMGEGYRIYRTAESKAHTKTKIELLNYFAPPRPTDRHQNMVFSTTLDLNRTIEFVSHLPKGFAGYEASFFLSQGQSFTSLIVPEDTPMVLRALQSATETQNAYSITYRIKSNSGKILWVMEHGKVQGMSEDHNGFCIASIIDISDSKEENPTDSKKRIAKLHQYATILQHCRSTGEIYRTCAKAGQALLNGECSSVFIHNDMDMKQIASVGKEEHGCETECVLGMAELALNTVSPCFFRSRDVKDEFCPAGISGVCFKLSDDAVFQIITKNNTVFGDVEKRIIELLLGYTKQGLKRISLQQQLIQQAIHDSLTGIYNRNYFNRVIELEEHRAKRLGTAIGFIMIDIDDFKSINDSFGHQIGDEVLIEIADLISKALRKTDTVLRYGGDEFLVILTRMATDQCQIIKDRIKKSVSISPGLVMTDESKVTISMGHAFWTPKAEETIDDVLGIADRVMYANKNKKRTKTDS